MGDCLNDAYIANMPGMKLEQIIRQTRQAKGLSQQKLADMAGVSKRSIVKWETQGKKPLIDSADKVCKALGISYMIGVGNGE